MSLLLFILLLNEHNVNTCPVNCAPGSGSTAVFCDETTGNCSNGCKPGWFGGGCDQTCSQHCVKPLCGQHDGHCYGGCKPGWFGGRCDQTCSKNCVKHICNQGNGHCSQGCAEGFSGNFCMKGQHAECPFGKFGESCDKNCPATCAPPSGSEVGRCHKLTGACYGGCVAGWYGDHCNQTCNSNCMDNICNQGNGHCTRGCKEKYVGDYCTEVWNEDGFRVCADGYFGEKCHSTCPENCVKYAGNKVGPCDKLLGTCNGGCNAGWFGLYCNHTCSKNCVNSLCNQSNGHCTNGCTSEHSGPFCRTESKGNSDALYTISVIPFAIVIIGILIWKRSKHNGPLPQGEPVSSTWNLVIESTVPLDPNLLHDQLRDTIRQRFGAELISVEEGSLILTFRHKSREGADSMMGKKKEVEALILQHLHQLDATAVITQMKVKLAEPHQNKGTLSASQKLFVMLFTMILTAVFLYMVSDGVASYWNASLAPHTGECLAGCRRGWYGEQCEQPCDVRCVLDLCDQADGHCTLGREGSGYRKESTIIPMVLGLKEMLLILVVYVITITVIAILIVPLIFVGWGLQKSMKDETNTIPFRKKQTQKQHHEIRVTAAKPKEQLKAEKIRAEGKLFAWGTKETESLSWTSEKVQQLRKKFFEHKIDKEGKLIRGRILMFGPSGSGKSSFCNGLRSALKDSDTTSNCYAVGSIGSSLTNSFQSSQYGDHWIIDMPGIFESSDFKTAYIEAIATGSVRSLDDLITKSLDVKGGPSQQDEWKDVSCAVLVLHHGITVGEELKRQIDAIIQLAGDGALSYHLVLTHLDECDPQFKDPDNLPNLYKSPRVQEAVKMISEQTGIPPYAISYVKNYVMETKTDTNTKLLHLKALDRILTSAAEQVEKMIDLKLQKKMYEDAPDTEQKKMYEDAGVSAARAKQAEEQAQRENQRANEERERAEQERRAAAKAKEEAAASARRAEQAKEQAQRENQRANEERERAEEERMAAAKAKEKAAASERTAEQAKEQAQREKQRANEERERAEQERMVAAKAKEKAAASARTAELAKEQAQRENQRANEERERAEQEKMAAAKAKKEAAANAKTAELAKEQAQRENQRANEERERAEQERMAAAKAKEEAGVSAARAKQAEEQAKMELKKALEAHEDATEQRRRAMEAQEHADKKTRELSTAEEQFEKMRLYKETAEQEKQRLEKEKEEKQRKDESLMQFAWGPKKTERGRWTSQEVERLSKKFHEHMYDKEGKLIHGKILMFGPSGAGKSSFCNGLRSALKDSATPANYYAVGNLDESLTSSFQPTQYGDHWIIDMPGIFESSDLKTENIEAIASGKVRFDAQITKRLDVKGILQEARRDVACVVLVLHHGITLGDELKRQIDAVIRLRGDGFLSYHLVLTHLDECDPQFKDPDNIPNLYNSPRVQEAVKLMSEQTGIPPYAISYVKNYVTETETDTNTKLLHLEALDRILTSTADQVEKMIDNKLKKKMYEDAPDTEQKKMYEDAPDTEQKKMYEDAPDTEQKNMYEDAPDTEQKKMYEDATDTEETQAVSEEKKLTSTDWTIPMSIFAVVILFVAVVYMFIQ